MCAALLFGAAILKPKKNDCKGLQKKNVGVILWPQPAGGIMEFGKKQTRARAILARLRSNGVKWRDISVMSGVSIGYLSGISEGYRQFSDSVADKIITGCKGAK
jgi:hypothetical protein